MLRQKAGQPWSIEEEQELLEGLRSGKTISQIASFLQRSEMAIQLRIGMLCQRWLEKKQMSRHEIEKNYHIMVDDYVKLYTSRQQESVQNNEIQELRREIQELSIQMKKLRKQLASCQK